MVEQSLTDQVKHNCHVSDANYWGYFSMCNLLLRLRDLYCHEHGLNPWDSLPRENVASWIAERESLWERLEGQGFDPIRAAEESFDPFDIDAINIALKPHGLVYGAGYGLLKKPAFFIGRLKAAYESDGHDVWIIQEELARDLAPPFAMSQGNGIFVRLKILSAYLYQRYLEMGSRSADDFLRQAFASLGLKQGEPATAMESAAEHVSQILVWHEMGEIEERLEGNPWLDLIAAAEDRLTEFRLRSIKDLLADTCDRGPVPRILDRRDALHLYLYAGLMDDMKRSLFPEFAGSLRNFRESQNWDALHQAVQDARARASELRHQILSLWKLHQDLKPIRALLASGAGR